MIKIGYDDEWNPEDQVRDKTPIEGQRRKFDNKDVYLSERTQKKLLAEYDSVVVNDYGDDYHIPEDELKARNKYYEAFAKLSKMNRKYKRLDEFVIAMRQSLACLDMVAKDNFLYDPEEFKKKWLDGKIEVFGLHHIVYKGKDRKQINWKYITDFIFSDKDPKELMGIEDEGYKTEEEIKEYYESLYTEEELEKIMDHSHDEEDDINFSNDILERDKVAEPVTKKDIRKMIKAFPEVAVGIKSFQKGLSDSEKVGRFGATMTYSDIEELRRYDVQQNFKKHANDGIPDFKGDIFDKDEFDQYMYQLDEYNDRHIKVNVSGKMRTKSEVDELEVKGFLESNGWNIRKLYDNESQIKRMKQESKIRDRKIRKMKKKLTKLSEERGKIKRRAGDYADDDRQRKKKKSGKKNKK